MKVLIFGGTTEGRKISTALSNAEIEVTLSVATEFGRDIAEDAGADILSDRLGEKDMIGLMKYRAFDFVIDATHPYAVEVTDNIRSACQAAGLKYHRLKRPASKEISGITYVPDTNAAVEILKKSGEKVLLTIGSKELESFAQIDNYAERFFIRILPMQDSLKKALDLGFLGSNIICMQGPFNKEMNMETLKMTGARCLVTKDSGDAGGFEAKVSAARSLGYKVIVIARPIQEEGYTFNELLEILNVTKTKVSEQTTFFPLFIDIKGKTALIIGGGKVAERRAKILSAHGAEVTVISPEIIEPIEHLASHCYKRKYQIGDIADLMPFLVIAASNDRQTNHDAMAEAKNLNTHVSVADCREECTCYFPAIAESENYIAGLISKKGNHTGVKQTAEKIRGLLNE